MSARCHELTGCTSRLLAHPVIVFNSGILELPDLVELLECYELLLEVLAVEFFEVLIAKDPVIFQFLLEKLSYLLRCQLPLLEELGGILRGAIELIFFMFYHFNSCLEESILLCPAHYLLLEIQLRNSVCGLLWTLPISRSSALQIELIEIPVPWFSYGPPGLWARSLLGAP